VSADGAFVEGPVPFDYVRDVVRSTAQRERRLATGHGGDDRA
jgi:hypothetical protein